MSGGEKSALKMPQTWQEYQFLQEQLGVGASDEVSDATPTNGWLPLPRPALQRQLRALGRSRADDIADQPSCLHCGWQPGGGSVFTMCALGRREALLFGTFRLYHSLFLAVAAETC